MALPLNGHGNIAIEVMAGVARAGAADSLENLIERLGRGSVSVVSGLVSLA